MIVTIAGHEVSIAREQVADHKWFASNVVDGTLVDGRQFRAWVDATRWARFLAGEIE